MDIIQKIGTYTAIALAASGIMGCSDNNGANSEDANVESLAQSAQEEIYESGFTETFDGQKVFYFGVNGQGSFYKDIDNDGFADVKGEYWVHPWGGGLVNNTVTDTLDTKISMQSLEETYGVNE